MKQLAVKFPEAVIGDINAGAQTFNDVNASEVARAAMKLGLEQLFELNRQHGSIAAGGAIKGFNREMKLATKEAGK